MSKQRPVLIAVVGDTHAGSTLGLCPGEGVMLPDTGRYTPSPVQLWIWENWLDYWGRVEKLAKQHKAKVIGVHMGDSVDGDHHATAQIITRDPEAQSYIMSHALLPMRKACSKLYVCRGTEAHIGAGMDDACGRALKAERHPDSETWASHEWMLSAGGVRIQARHHWTQGQLPWTKHGAAVRLAAQIFAEYAEHAAKTGSPLTYPHIALRGHMHRYADSGDAQPVRVLGVPSWQAGTSFVARITQSNLNDIGGWIILCDNGQYQATPILYTPERGTEIAV